MSRLRIGVLLFVASVAAATAPARAQEPPGSDTTLEPTTSVPGTDTTPTTAVDPSSTTILGDPGSTTSTTLPPADDPALNGDAPSDTVPDVDVTVPPRDPVVSGRYASQGDFGSYPGRIVRVTARNAEARSGEAHSALAAAIARRDSLVSQQAVLEQAIATLAVEEREAIEDLEAAQRHLEERAVDAYIRGDGGPVDALLSSENATDLGSRLEILEVVLEADQQAIEDFRKARQRVDGDQARRAQQLADVRSQLPQAEADIAAAQLNVELVDRELAVALAGGTVVIHGFAFPVAGPVNYSDTFGAPRMPGTQYAHWHEGTDIFAPAGTPLVACERGVITRLRNNVLGGITLWVKGESGTSYYYAHLLDYAPGISEGLVVDAGTIVGFVGNTGNAATTPSHLHFEVHPYGGPAVNPYPLLVVAEQQPQPPAFYLGTPPPGAPTIVNVPADDALATPAG